MSVSIADLNTYNAINLIDFGEKIVFFKIGADWCEPCVRLDKILNSIPNSIVYQISIDNYEFTSFFMENKFYSIPDTIIKYKDSTARFQGLITEQSLIEMIQKMK
jgi:thiol-disulfide isomerase/thioredoxin